MIQYTTHTEQETHRLGERLGGCLRGGDVVLLSGELGAGKSVMARGIARGLGHRGAMPSPTFTLMVQHRGGVYPLYHMDLYRLEDSDALWESGLEEYIGGDGVALIEWPERAMDAMPTAHLHITIDYAGEQGRIITLMPRGEFAAQRLCAMEGDKP